MPKFIKPGKVVIVLNGRFAGRKAVVVKNFDEGTKERPYAHALVTGVEKYPYKVTKDMARNKLVKRSNLKPFSKIVNYSHIMPTRYGLDIDFKNVVSSETVYGDAAKRKETKKKVKKLLRERYLQGKNKWFFTKLRF